MLAIKYITGRVGWAKLQKLLKWKESTSRPSCSRSAACTLSIWIHHFCFWQIKVSLFWLMRPIAKGKIGKRTLKHTAKNKKGKKPGWQGCVLIVPVVNWDLIQVFIFSYFLACQFLLYLWSKINSFYPQYIKLNIPVSVVVMSWYQIGRLNSMRKGQLLLAFKVQNMCNCEIQILYRSCCILSQYFCRFWNLRTNFQRQCIS